MFNIDKETYKNNDIEAIYYYNKEKNRLELWLKMSDIEIQLGHSNIGDVVLKRVRKYLGKKTKYVIKVEKEQYKCYSENLNPNIFKTKNNRLIIQ